MVPNIIRIMIIRSILNKNLESGVGPEKKITIITNKQKDNDISV